MPSWVGSSGPTGGRGRHTGSAHRRACSAALSVRLGPFAVQADVPQSGLHQAGQRGQLEPGAVTVVVLRRQGMGPQAFTSFVLSPIWA